MGIGQNKLQAKLATGFGKPAGVFRLTGQNWFAVLGDRPTDALWGIGAKTAQKLAALGLNTVRELAAAEPDALAAVFGPTTGPWLVRWPTGAASRPWTTRPTGPARTGGKSPTSRTSRTGTRSPGEVAAADAVAAELAGAEPDDGAAAAAAVRVVVKVRYAPFITVTHGQPLAGPTVAAAPIRAAALAALGRFTPAAGPAAGSPGRVRPGPGPAPLTLGRV